MKVSPLNCWRNVTVCIHKISTYLTGTCIQGVIKKQYCNLFSNFFRLKELISHFTAVRLFLYRLVNYFKVEIRIWCERSTGAENLHSLLLPLYISHYSITNNFRWQVVQTHKLFYIDVLLYFNTWLFLQMHLLLQQVQPSQEVRTVETVNITERCREFYSRKASVVIFESNFSLLSQLFIKKIMLLICLLPVHLYRSKCPFCCIEIHEIIWIFSDTNILN